MRRFAVLAFALVGCAHTTETHESSVVVAPPAVRDREVIAVDTAAPVEVDARPARPRLSQTITLGQSNGAMTYSAAPPPGAQQGQGGGGPNVVVNNNVVVQQAPPVYLAPGWGYGYGGGYGRGSYARTESVGRSGGQWGTTGFEGPRRTAAPGQTPGVGGNWAPAPSYGPAPMK